MTPRNPIPGCVLALEDGTVFFGQSFGATGTRSGEVVFNTAMGGYQEVLTDPSYCGQIVTMTFPQMGNYGINDEDVESTHPQVAGFVVKELSPRASNFRSRRTLADYLAAANIVGIQGIDTRTLTRKLRVDGAMKGVLTTEIDDPVECVRLAGSTSDMTGADLVKVVAPKKSSVWTEGLDGRGAVAGKLDVVAIDCGMKRNILRNLVSVGCGVTVVPPTSSVGEVLDCKPKGVFISNGPGDPAAVHYAIDLIKGLIGRVPIFGICLGHQLLGLALGASTFKLKFGHRGANQPVKNLGTGRVEITSQNHGFAVDPTSLERVGGLPTHTNLNDGTLEGFVHRDHPILAVQYHPEAAPGPHDATYLFDCFTQMMRTGRAPSAEDMATAQSKH